tara:strand:- start:89 stop:208 length:120 start_codon:yes stop_codon:yes gene_type:complete
MRIVSQIGKDGTGKVYQAKDLSKNKLVAIKAIHPPFSEK